VNTETHVRVLEEIVGELKGLRLDLIKRANNTQDNGSSFSLNRQASGVGHAIDVVEKKIDLAKRYLD